MACLGLLAHVARKFPFLYLDGLAEETMLGFYQAVVWGHSQVRTFSPPPCAPGHYSNSSRACCFVHRCRRMSRPATASGGTRAARLTPWATAIRAMPSTTTLVTPSHASLTLHTLLS